MKICLFGISGIALGKHNVKDPRLDQADKLVEAKKKTYVQVDLVGQDEVADADGILVLDEVRADLILHDLEFVEMRLGRDPQPAELALLNRLKESLEKEEFVFTGAYTPQENESIASYGLWTIKSILSVSKQALEDPEESLLKLVHLCGYISFFTVGGKENRAWLIKKGMTAWEGAGTIHSDIQKGFIRAEIISIDDLLQAGGETQAKRAGKMRLELKDYVLQDCDITNFRFNK
jgi:ribosome-binding ATPase YchF (GTP1/OBG family)